MSKKIIVVGGGHNGLVAAAYLAMANHRVTVLERRSVVGGCAVTEEIDPETEPGCRVSTASYIASMLNGHVINDLKLGSYGLRMVPCEPGVQAAFSDGDVVSHWNDHNKLKQELQRVAPDDCESFFATERELKRLARYLQPFFLESPPNIDARGLDRWRQLIKTWRRFRNIDEADAGALVAFLTGSLGDFLDRRFSSDKLKRLILSNSLYGKHGGPYQPGTAMGLLFHLLDSGEERQQGFQGHVIGGMGAISESIASACRDLGVDIQTDATVTSIDVANGRVKGVTLNNNHTLDADVVVSNADPKRTFLNLVEPTLLPNEFVDAIKRIRMGGPCAKVNYVLDKEPEVSGMPKTHTPVERSLFTLVPTLSDAEDSYNQARKGELPDKLWVDCVLASNVDGSLVTPNRHVLTCFVQYLPYQLSHGSWDQQRETLGENVTRIIGNYAKGFKDSIKAQAVITPLDLERRFGITEGNIFHGDLSLEQMFFSRPVPGWSRYATPIQGLYLCGAGTHPGGGVTGAPGYNAAKAISQACGSNKL